MGINFSQFLIACQKGDLETTKQWLQQTASDIPDAINNTDANGCTPLYFACAQGHIAIVELLLQQPTIDIRKATNDDISPLKRTMENNQVSIATLLLGSHVNGNCLNLELSNIGDPHINNILAFLIQNPQILRIDLNNNNITSEGTKMLVNGLQKTKVISLNLCENNININEITEIKELFLENKNLIELRIDNDYNFTSHELEIIQDESAKRFKEWKNGNARTIYSTGVLFCDGYLAFPGTEKLSQSNYKTKDILRYWDMYSRFPLEIQARLANLTAGLNKEVIPADKQLDLAFKHVFQRFGS